MIDVGLIMIIDDDGFLEVLSEGVIVMQNGVCGCLCVVDFEDVCMFEKVGDIFFIGEDVILVIDIWFI